MRYVSIVGTQVMAVLNPLLALNNAGYDIDGVDLLVTTNEKSAAHANTISNFLAGKKLYKAEDINVIQISDSLAKNDEGRLPAQTETMKIVENGDIAFNLAGGLNFQVAACVYQFPPEKCLFLYPEATAVHALRMDGEKITFNDSLPLPDTVDVLRLQGIDFTDDPIATMSPFLDYAMKLTSYGSLVKNIRPVSIHGSIFFDHFWNDGNELRFLKVIHAPKKVPGEGGKNTEYYLKEGRKIISLATTREAFGELYHRRIAVITNNPTIAERLREEGGGKIDIIQPEHSKNNGGKGFQKDMERFFGVMSLPSSNKAETCIANLGGPATSSAKVLYMPLGRNLMPTLIALWTHRPFNVCFLFTQNDKEILKMKAAMIKHKQIIPAQKLRFIPVSIEGTEILDLQNPNETDNVEVNISPGTKGHTAFLSLWAKKNGINLYSLETKTQTLQGITSGKRMPLQGPSPLDYLRLSGKIIREGTTSETIRSRHKTYKAINTFIQEMAKEKGSIDNFPEEDIALHHYHYKLIISSKGYINIPSSDAEVEYRSNFLDYSSGEITERQGKGKLTNWSLAHGIWFENLIGYCLLQAGADDVHVRIRTARDPDMEKYLKKKYPGQDIFLSDIDVAARVAANYYVVSCKATKQKSSNITASEIAAMSTLFGRFAIPMVAFLKYGGEPFQVENKVWIFGYKTFADANAMKNLLDAAVAEKQKTRKEP